MMIGLMPEAIWGLNYTKLAPYDGDDLVYFVNAELAFILKDIHNSNKDFFSISEVMKKTEVFACKDFEKTLSKFVDNMQTRLERYFTTKKSRYIFFDEEEQKVLKGLLSAFDLYAHIDIMVLNKESGEYEKKQFDEIPIQERRKVVLELNKIKARIFLQADEYNRMSILASNKTEENRERMEQVKLKASMKRMGKLFKRYPKLSKFSTKVGVDKYYKKLSIKYHPDKGGDHDIFAQLSQDFKEIKESPWYQGLE